MPETGMPTMKSVTIPAIAPTIMTGHRNSAASPRRHLESLPFLADDRLLGRGPREGQRHRSPAAAAEGIPEGSRGAFATELL